MTSIAADVTEAQGSTMKNVETYHITRWSRTGGMQWEAWGMCEGQKFDVLSPVGDSDEGYDFVIRQLRAWREKVAR